jgi:hypothetical protein
MSGIYLNVDNMGYYNGTYETNIREKMEEQAIRQYVRVYAGTQVKGLIFCVNAQRANYASKRVGRFWDGFDPDAGPDQPFMRAYFPTLKFPEDIEKTKAAYFVMKLYCDMEKAGIDPFVFMFDECRKSGMERWISYRMNDRHCVDEIDHPFHADIWKKDHGIWRCDYHFEGWNDRAMNYGLAVVRDYYYTMIEETLERYDVDGVELDWMRSGYHFKPGAEDEGIKILNDYMLRVRRLLDCWELKRGHRIQMSARVPSRPESAYYLGYDPAEWARQGWIDRLVATNHWGTTDTDTPVEIWKRLLAGTKTKLDIGCEDLIRPNKKFPAYPGQTLETLRGCAISALARGADGVYLFNYFYVTNSKKTTPYWEHGVYDSIYRETGELYTIRNKPRRHVVAYADTQGEGEAAVSALPRRLEKEHYTAFRVSVGEPPASGRKAWVVAAFAAPDAIDTSGAFLPAANRLYEADPAPPPAAAADAEVRVNGLVCQPDTGVGAAAKVIQHPLCWRIPEDAIRGHAAVVEIHGTDATVIWLEIYIE